MDNGPYGHYSAEFRKKAVLMVVEEEMSVAKVAGELSVPESTLRNWLVLYRKGRLEEIGGVMGAESETGKELAGLKKELYKVKQEWDILKKASEFF
jgi:transposase